MPALVAERARAPLLSVPGVVFDLLYDAGHVLPLWASTVCDVLPQLHGFANGFAYGYSLDSLRDTWYWWVLLFDRSIDRCRVVRLSQHDVGDDRGAPLASSSGPSPPAQ